MSPSSIPPGAAALERLIQDIDAILPQTQCTKCGYLGCKPYATAMAKGEADINQCPPSGSAGIRKLAALLNREGKPLNPNNGVEKPRAVAVIDEALCIGCTLCIQACPVDAIVGAAKQMHTVIRDHCTGCELCVPPCPVDCISMAPLPAAEAAWTAAHADAARERFYFRNFRLERDKAEQAERLAQKAQAKKAELTNAPDTKKAAILAAIERAKAQRAAVQPRNTDNLPPEVKAQIAEIEARRSKPKP